MHFAALSGGLTTEIKYLWYKKKHDWIITPKVGIGVGGLIMLNYGYNISMRKKTFEQVGQHQFGIIINLPIDTYALDYD